MKTFNIDILGGELRKEGVYHASAVKLPPSCLHHHPCQGTTQQWSCVLFSHLCPLLISSLLPSLSFPFLSSYLFFDR